MSRVSRIAAACVCATVLGSAAPALAVPAEPIVDTENTEFKQRRKSTVSAAPTSPEKIKQIAMSVVGTPYSWGGATPAGFDCSGLTSWVYAHVGITLPHSSDAQYALAGTPGFTRVEEIDDLRMGDLVFHNSDGSGIGHVGIYVGNDRFISTTSSEGVQVRSLFDSYWGPLWVGGVRVSA